MGNVVNLKEKVEEKEAARMTKSGQVHIDPDKYPFGEIMSFEEAHELMGDRVFTDEEEMIEYEGEKMTVEEWEKRSND